MPVTALTYALVCTKQSYKLSLCVAFKEAHTQPCPTNEIPITSTFLFLFVLIVLWKM